MRIALVASLYVRRPGSREGYVQRLARGLAIRGVEIEVFTHDGHRRLPRISMADGVPVRRLRRPGGSTELALAPALWEHLRSASYDVTHVYGGLAGLGLAVARAGVGQCAFTPGAPIEQLLRWPHARVLRAMVQQADLTICRAHAEADLLCRRLPAAVGRVRSVHDGIAVDEIQAARPVAQPGKTVLIVARLEREARVDRAISAMCALDSEFRLVVVGDGPARRSLRAHAADLGVSNRVEFIGGRSDALLYSWLRTAAVVVTLAERQCSGAQLLEAVVAGAPVVASDIPTHREAAAYVPEDAVKLVSPLGSPLEVAHAISAIVGTPIKSNGRPSIPTWDETVESTLALYEALGQGPPAAGRRSRRFMRSGSSRRDRGDAEVGT